MKAIGNVCEILIMIFILIFFPKFFLLIVGIGGLVILIAYLRDRYY